MRLTGCEQRSTVALVMTANEEPAGCGRPEGSPEIDDPIALQLLAKAQAQQRVILLIVILLAVAMLVPSALPLWVSTPDAPAGTAP